MQYKIVNLRVKNFKCFDNAQFYEFRIEYEKNPIIHQIKEESLYSTGHGTIIEKNGEMYYFLHGRDNVEHDRTLYLAKININSTTDVSVDKVEMCKLIEE